MEDNIITVHRLSFEVDGIPTDSIVELALRRKRGYLIAGPNDMANVRLLETMGGILPPPEKTGGSVLFDGCDLYESPEKSIKTMKRKIAYVFREGVMISNITVKENLLLPLRYHNPGLDVEGTLQRIAEGFRFFDIPDILEMRPADISYDVKKKLAFIRASLQEPELILLQRPMFNLEERDRRQVIRFLVPLKRKGVTFIIVSRCVSLMEALFDEVILLEQGSPPLLIDKSHPDYESNVRQIYCINEDVENNGI
jgi:phospholipid/cholesterol/gamma-HCH transport system ATP-binding protein